MEQARICIEIIEQPAQNHTRFRYKCEARNSKIPGENNTRDNPTYPTIQVFGRLYDDEKIVINVSCVTKDKPYTPHPYNLIGEGCKDGIYKQYLDKKTMTVIFSDLKILCVKKHEFVESLELRRRKRLFSSRYDDFRPVYDPASQNFDLNCLRLCFQGFLYRKNGDHDQVIPLKPIVSQPIFNNRSTAEQRRANLAQREGDKDFQIVRLSPAHAAAEENTEITLLCTKVTEGNCEVLFLNKSIKWWEKGTIIYFHQQAAIVVQKPRYDLINNQAVKMDIQLRSTNSPNKCSNPIPFWFLPNKSDSPRRKIPKKIDRSQMTDQNILYSTVDFLPFQSQYSSRENNIEQFEQELAAMRTPSSTNEISSFTPRLDHAGTMNVDRIEIINQFDQIFPSCSNNQDTTLDNLISGSNSCADSAINNRSQPFMLNSNVGNPAEMVPNLPQISDSIVPSFSSTPDFLELDNSDTQDRELFTSEMMNAVEEIIASYPM